MLRRLWLAFFGFLLVALVIAGWSGYRALQVRDDLTAAQATTTQLQGRLQDGDAAALEAGLPALRVRLDAAARRTDGPVWAVAERFPVLGRNLRAVRQTALAAQLLGDQALPEATEALDLVRRSKPLRAGRVDLAVLAQLSAHVDRAAAATHRARALLVVSDKPLIGVLRRKVTEAQAKVAELDGTLSSAAKALDLAPGMLGQAGPRRYFVAVQNNAEARATGGLIGAYAVVVADHGALTLERTGADTDLRADSTVPVASDPQAAQSWQDEGSTLAWFDANLTPHFPDVARNVAGLWTRQSGQHVDGVIALDPVVMGHLLTASGPVRLPDGTAVSASSVADFVGRDEYVRYPEGPPRKLVLAALAADLFHTVVTSPDAVATLKAFAASSTSGHLFLWSAHPDEQQRLAQGLVGGALPATDTPYLSVLTQNYGGDKLDFYVRRTVTVTPLRNGQVTLTVTLRNTAPRGLPDYVTVRSDRPTPPVPYAQAKVGLSVYGALSSTFGAATLDGKPALLSFDTDHGHPFGTLSLELPQGKDVTFTVLLTQPPGVLDYRQQPLVAPDALTINAPHRVRGL